MFQQFLDSGLPPARERSPPADYDLIRPPRFDENINPQEWIQVREGNEPMTGGLLATWDISGVNGLYAVQLQMYGAIKGWIQPSSR